MRLVVPVESRGRVKIPLLLSKSQIEDLVDLPQAIACVERAFLEQGRGHVTPWDHGRFLRHGASEPWSPRLQEHALLPVSVEDLDA